jgi:hypothetical protein
VLEKQTPKGGWRAIEGNDAKAPIVEAYKTASSVAGSIFRVMDNTGDEPKMLMTNEEPAKATKPAKTEKEPAKG